MSPRQFGSDTGPWVGVPRWLWDSDISDGALRLYIVISGYADNETLDCTVLRSTLAQRSRCHVKTLDRYVKELIEARALTVVTHRGANSYVIHRADPMYAGSKSLPASKRAGKKSRSACREQILPGELEGLQTRNPLADGAAVREGEKQRERDLLFEALCSTCGIDWNELSQSQRSRVNGVRKRLVEVGATPREVQVRARAFGRRFPNAVLTDVALEKHWATLGNGQAAAPERTPEQAAEDERRLAEVKRALAEDIARDKNSGGSR